MSFMSTANQSFSGVANWISSEVANGLKVLAEAKRFQDQSSLAQNQFAIELTNLREHGLSINATRWLVQNGFVTHWIEIGQRQSNTRYFEEGGTAFEKRSCFSITEKGLEFFESIGPPAIHQRELKLLSDLALVKDQISSSGQEVPALPQEKPHWKSERKELWYCGQLVKSYRLPSPNQIAIISAFSEDGWPDRIDDPLPQTGETSPKRRLQDTIRNLNRSMKSEFMRFLGDGSGEGILWESRVRSDCVSLAVR